MANSSRTPDHISERPLKGRIPKQFSMFSKAGNDAVHQMLSAALNEHKSRDALCAAIWRGVDDISNTHSEIKDTMVREDILWAVQRLKPDFSIDELYPRIKFGKHEDGTPLG